MRSNKRKPKKTFHYVGGVVPVFWGMVVFAFVVVLGAMFIFSSAKGVRVSSGDYSNVTHVNSNGVQVISIQAKNGFSPTSITARANIKSVLRVTTSNTVDCSNVINIPSLGISKSLPITGETDIDIPPQAPGSTITGTCGAGVSRLVITFV